MKEEKRKQRQESFHTQVIATSKKILLTKSLDALSMRSIANEITCSQSKIYEVFKDKNHLCETLCGEFCQILLERLQKVYENQNNAEKLLKKLFEETLIFHTDYPHTDTLFTLVCFGGPQFSLPSQFLKIEKLFIEALAQLKSPRLNNQEKITSALTAIRFLFIGASQLSVFGSVSSQKLAKEALNDLIRGWLH